MFLIIDNTEDGKVIFSFTLDNKLISRANHPELMPKDPSSKTFVISKNKGLLVCLEKLLAGLKLKLKDIKYLGVVVGEGRFTATRLAVTAVNTLAFSLKIPVVALPKNFNQAAALKLAKSAVVGTYVVPIYSAEAHVG